MNESATGLGKLPPGQSGLACRVRHKQLRRSPSPTAGEVELENVSPEVIEIIVQMMPFQYLDLIVRDSAGKVVSTSHYGDIFSPHEKPYVFRLQPGEKYTGPVSLVGNVPKDKQLPGRYSVHAVYEYEGVKAVSEPLEVQLPGDGEKRESLPSPEPGARAGSDRTSAPSA